MNGLFQRINNRVRLTQQRWQSDSNFSVKYALLRLLDDYSYRLGVQTIANTMHEKKLKWELNYIKNRLQNQIDQYRAEKKSGEQTENAPIWVCWWTGLDSAPILVKRCVESIMRNAGSHPVNLITEKNYQEYLDIPEFFHERLANKEIGIAHFSDYLRICLLEKYGGLWLDATIFCTQPIPGMYFEFPVFTCKSPRRKSRYLSEYQWVTFCLGGWKGNTFFRFLKAAFEQYWKENSGAIDYLFFDDLIYLAKENIPYIKELLERIPENNLCRDDLQRAMNDALPAEEFANIVKDDTYIYKLSWREQYQAKCDTGLTIYGSFIQMKQDVEI